MTRRPPDPAEVVAAVERRRHAFWISTYKSSAEPAGGLHKSMPVGLDAPPQAHGFWATLLGEMLYCCSNVNKRKKQAFAEHGSVVEPVPTWSLRVPTLLHTFSWRRDGLGSKTDGTRAFAGRVLDADGNVIEAVVASVDPVWR
eukprot:3184315-Prymnesium_polylepis.1